MGCCQGIHETGEVNVSMIQDKDRQEWRDMKSNEVFNDLNLSYSSEELDFQYRFTEVKDFVYTTRASNNSMHFSEIEKAFLRTSSVL